MPGLESVLCGDSESKFILLSVERGPATFILDYIRKLYKNHSDPSKFQIHIVSMAHDFSILKDQSNVVIYDFINNPFRKLEEFMGTYTNNKNSAVKNILIIDDLQIFSVNIGKNFGRAMVFFKALAKTCQIVTVLNRDTASAEELSFFYKESDAVVTITNEPNQNNFLCNIVKTKYSGKIVHEQTSFSVVNGEFSEILKPVLTQVPQTKNQQNVLSTLTTFKLTLEEDEKKSKNLLHLPYFNAQSAEVSDPDFDMFDDEDEEDEDM